MLRDVLFLLLHYLRPAARAAISPAHFLFGHLSSCSKALVVNHRFYFVLTCLILNALWHCSRWISKSCKLKEEHSKLPSSRVAFGLALADFSQHNPASLGCEPFPYLITELHFRCIPLIPWRFQWWKQKMRFFFFPWSRAWSVLLCHQYCFTQHRQLGALSAHTAGSQPSCWPSWSRARCYKGQFTHRAHSRSSSKGMELSRACVLLSRALLPSSNLLYDHDT